MSKNRGQSQRREGTRGNKLSRLFSNKAGIQLVVSRYFDKVTKFMKTETVLQREHGKTIVGYKYN